MNVPIPTLEGGPQKRPVTIGILVSVAVMICIFFIAAFIFFQPDQLSLSDQYFPSPTATLTPSPTPTPTLTPTPTPNLTATQQVIRATATAQAVQSTIADAENRWKILMSDTFEVNDKNWEVGADQSERVNIDRKIINGKYQWNATSKKGFIAWMPADTISLGDFSLSIDTQRIDGSDLSDSGLVFRKNSKGDFYYFSLNQSGFDVSLLYNDDWTTLIERTSSSAILPGESNRLTVIAKGSSFIFLINNQFVAEISDVHTLRGTTALAFSIFDADLQATYEFDNFELRRP